MKVFISWSGEPSRLVARALREWLPLVAQHIRPWMSDEEISSGTRWNERIAKSLNETNFGIVCVTRANQHKPWLIFEAGALAKHLEASAVVPLCIDIAPGEVTGPLEAFQARCFNEEGMRRLVHDISRSRDEPLAGGQVDKLFDGLWPEICSVLAIDSEDVPAFESPRRDQQEMIEELVDRVRGLERALRGTMSAVSDAVKNVGPPPGYSNESPPTTFVPAPLTFHFVPPPEPSWREPIPASEQ